MYLRLLFIAIALPAVLGLPQQASPVEAPGARSPLLDRAAAHIPTHDARAQPSKRQESHHPKPSSTPPHDHHARAPQPSHRAKRAENSQERLKGITGAEIDFSPYLCPVPASACPIDKMTAAPSSVAEWHNVGFECVDFQNELKSCGGCASLSKGTDCTTIPGAHHVACSMGRCLAHSCKTGFTLDTSTHTCVIE